MTFDLGVTGTLTLTHAGLICNICVPNDPQVAVTFDLDANGILTVTAEDKTTKAKADITITQVCLSHTRCVLPPRQMCLKHPRHGRR